MQEYASQYQEIWNSIGDPEKISVIVEVGINDGDGVRKLKAQYPKAHIFAFDVHSRTSAYNKPYDDIAKELEDLATIIIQKSPLPYPWAYPYDLCTIDIGSYAEINMEVLNYWIKYKKPSGILVMLIPKGDEAKRERKAEFMEMLNKTELKYEELKPNWLIFR